MSRPLRGIGSFLPTLQLYQGKWKLLLTQSHITMKLRIRPTKGRRWRRLAVWPCSWCSQLRQGSAAVVVRPGSYRWPSCLILISTDNGFRKKSTSLTFSDFLGKGWEKSLESTVICEPWTRGDTTGRYPADRGVGYLKYCINIVGWFKFPDVDT